MDLIDILFGAILGGGGRGRGGSGTVFVPAFGTLASVSTGTSWSGDDPYTSTVTVTGYTVTANTMVSVLPTSDVIEQMIADGTTNIFITNNNGTLTATAISAAPTVAMTLQVLCTESDLSSEIAALPAIVGDGIFDSLSATNLTDAVNELKNALSDKPDIDLGITGASVGQIIKVLTVDANGKPQTWEAVDQDEVVTVSGTTPVIVAEAGKSYECGECSTLSIAPPANGMCNVIFESGSTATVLTITPPTGVTVKWANGFDPTALEANRTYEISIKNGLGVACAWT